MTETTPQKFHVSPEAYTVREFCEAYRLSRTALYKAWSEGIGPQKTRVFGKVLIGKDAARQWWSECVERSREDVV